MYTSTGDHQVDAVDDVVAELVIRPAGDRAAPHGHHVLRLRHEVVEPPHPAGHLVVDRAGDDHQVGLPRAGAKRPGAETIEVEAAGPGRHHLDGATGHPEGHRPQARLPRPVDRLLQGRREDVLFQPSFDPRLSHGTLRPLGVCRFPANAPVYRTASWFEIGSQPPHPAGTASTPPRRRATRKTASSPSRTRCGRSRPGWDTDRHVPSAWTGSPNPRPRPGCGAGPATRPASGFAPPPWCPGSFPHTLGQRAGDAAKHLPSQFIVLHLAELAPQGQGQVGEVGAGGHHALLGEPVAVFRPPAPGTDRFPLNQRLGSQPGEPLADSRRRNFHRIGKLHDAQRTGDPQQVQQIAIRIGCFDAHEDFTPLTSFPGNPIASRNQLNSTASELF